MIIKLKNDFCIDTDDLENHAEFLVDNKKISYYHGFFMAAFIALCNNHTAIIDNNISSYNNTQIHFEFWCQNRLPPLPRFEKFYYDAIMDTICFKSTFSFYSQIVTLSTIDTSKIKFNGSKTKFIILDFLDNYKFLREKLELTY